MADVTVHTWGGEQAANAENYLAQMALPVHLVGTNDVAFMKAAKMNPFNGREDDSADGQARLVHTTKCGLVLGSAIMRSTEDAADVTCQACAE